MQKTLKKYINKFQKASIIVIIIMFAFYHPCFADENMEELDFTWNEFQNIIKASSEMHTEPKINSRVAVIFDRASGDIIYGKEENKKYKMASTTKIMTAIVVLENSKLTDVVEISKKAANTGGSRLGLKIDDKITVNDLLYGLMLCSGNDCAVALAEYCSGSVEDFSTLMNSKAQSLGLSSTHFVTPHGLDNENHYSTAHDFALLTDYALKNPQFVQIVGTKKYTVSLNGSSKSITNTNELLGSIPSVYGVKTGYTSQAGRCLITASKQDDLDIIVVVFGADTKSIRTNDSANLINYMHSTYTTINLKDLVTEKYNDYITHIVPYIKIDKISDHINPQIENNYTSCFVIRKDNIDKINVSLIDYPLKAPVYKNDIIATIKVYNDNKELLRVNITAQSDLKVKSALDYLKYFFINYKLLFIA